MDHINQIANMMDGEDKPGGPDEMARAKESDLITLPPDIEGTNCGNCKYIRDDNYCFHPKVEQAVTPRQCCKYWDNSKVVRPWTNGSNQSS